MTDGQIIVTGAKGLVGHRVRCLLERQGRAVIAVDRDAGEVDGLPVQATDVTDVHALHGLVHDNRAVGRVGGIVHCGAFSGPMVAADRPMQMIEVNLVGTANVLELARRLGGVRVVFCSSTSAVGDTPQGLRVVSEDVPTNPSTVYGASKAASENLVAGYRRQFAVDGVSLRLSWVYGPRRTTPCSIRRMLEDALASRPTRFPFGRNVPRQYVHVDDAARALALALDAPRLPGLVYAVTGGTCHGLGEVAALVREILPTADIEVVDGPDPTDDVQARFSIDAAERAFAYRPEVPLRDGIRAYYDWLAKLL